MPESSTRGLRGRLLTFTGEADEPATATSQTA